MINSITSIADLFTEYWSVTQERLLSVPMPWRAVLVIVPLILITIWLIVFVFPCIVATVLRSFPCLARLTLCLECRLTRFARAINCRPPWIFYIIGDMLAGCVRLLQKKKSVRPKKWYALLLVAAVFAGILLVPTGKSFLILSMNKYAAWWHEFTLYDQTYTVRRNDSLSGIAQKYGISMHTIVSANKERHPSLAKNPNSIKVGWELKIPQR